MLTASISIFAHIWMLLVYSWWTPDQITPAEAWLTLAFFPITLVVAWIVDTRPWRRKNMVGVAG